MANLGSKRGTAPLTEEQLAHIRVQEAAAVAMWVRVLQLVEADPEVAADLKAMTPEDLTAHMAAAGNPSPPEIVKMLGEQAKAKKEAKTAATEAAAATAAEARGTGAGGGGGGPAATPRAKKARK